MIKLKSATLAVGVTAAILLGFSAAPVRAATHVSIGVGVGYPYPAHYPVHVWARGYWHRGWYGPRFGWWWVVGPSWYYYPQPVYPYPQAYAPPVIVQATPAKPGPAPEQYWYYCDAARKYYPYVSACPGGWQRVPVTPPPAAATGP